jgi:hypothetical protein
MALHRDVLLSDGFTGSQIFHNVTLLYEESNADELAKSRKMANFENRDQYFQ